MRAALTIHSNFFGLLRLTKVANLRVRNGENLIKSFTGEALMADNLTGAGVPLVALSVVSPYCTAPRRKAAAVVAQCSSRHNVPPSEENPAKQQTIREQAQALPVTVSFWRVWTAVSALRREHQQKGVIEFASGS
jgi:hypothetical protein